MSNGNAIATRHFGQCLDRDSADSPDDTPVAHCFAVVKLSLSTGDVPEGWAPRKPESVPPADLAGLPGDLVSPFVRAYNASGHARLKNRIAVQLVSGGMLRVHVPAHQRATDATALPPGSEPFAELTEARHAAYSRNAAILETARVPRVWYVVAHVLTTREGGDRHVA